MSKAYLITYNLDNANVARGHNYDLFYAEIKKCGFWWHYLPNVWIVITEENVLDLQKRLVPKIVTTDRLLIIEVKKPHGGYLPKEAWEWINTRIPA